MSYQSSLVKLAIKLTPTPMILWVANKVLKDIAELRYFHFDIDARKLYVEIQLLGESETIEIFLEGFHMAHEQTAYRIVIEQARSNRLWLGNLLSRFTGKAWKIPEIPQYAHQMKLLAEVMAPRG
ncbi:hypothetical protein SAMN02949497_4629 [Methylomagnum ishizawai]|uniref:Uncharacterized protein n=1 Tax=Methylomagnum ishizawai TaxID=1760988 RepID=A0A1Y6D460_9GAMM|nr:hypothetical protein [Methylomagnum ishizawai]SMF97210.1 hypothetical protein SAMN02949497_4629 [Methylomagnum ishizawai]